MGASITIFDAIHPTIKSTESTMQWNEFKEHNGIHVVLQKQNRMLL